MPADLDRSLTAETNRRSSNRPPAPAAQTGYPCRLATCRNSIGRASYCFPNSLTSLIPPEQSVIGSPLPAAELASPRGMHEHAGSYGPLVRLLGGSSWKSSANFCMSLTSSSISRSFHFAKSARPRRSRAASTASVIALPFGVTTASRTRWSSPPVWRFARPRLSNFVTCRLTVV
jgi:hypothetical protein